MEVYCLWMNYNSLEAVFNDKEKLIKYYRDCLKADSLHEEDEEYKELFSMDNNDLFNYLEENCHDGSYIQIWELNETNKDF